MANEFISYAGQIIVDSIILYSADKKKNLDISLLFSELDFFEDIYANSIVGTVSMVEGFNLTSEFPIIGEELIVFTAHTPTFNEKISKRFAVIGISDKIVESSKKQIYTINFITLEALVDLNVKVYRAYTGTPSDSASQIFKTYFPTATLQVEDSVNAIKIVSPTISPFTLINLFASKAIDKSAYGAPNFLFYEDNKTYNFVSLSSLFKQKPKTSLKWSLSQMRDRNDQGVSVRDINEEYANVKEITIDNLFNTLDKNMSAALGHKVIEVDLIRKTIGKKTYSYIENFKDTPHLNPNPTNSSNLMYSHDSFVETCISHPGSHNMFHQDRDAIILAKRPALLAQNEFIKLELIIHGRTNIKVGDVINFEMGKFQSGDAEGQFKDEQTDNYYSGNYLIAAARHRFTLNRHEMIIEVIKESFNKGIKF